MTLGQVDYKIELKMYVLKSSESFCLQSAKWNIETMHARNLLLDTDWTMACNELRNMTNKVTW